MSIFVRTDLMSSAYIFSVRPAHGYGRRLTCFRRRLFCVYAPLIGAADTTTKKNKEKGANHMKKRVLSLILALVMLIGVLPVNMLAAEPADELPA